MTTPIFLLSLPRSGSTLLQRMLARVPGIRTSPEPWVLVPLLARRSPYVQLAEWGARASRLGYEEFQATLAAGAEGQALEAYALTLYEAAADGAPYFVDKTPRYSLFVPQLTNAFGDRARYVVLLRNPLAIAASACRTWSRSGAWNPELVDLDLGHGGPSLVSLTRDPALADVVTTVHYEDLVSRPDAVLDALADWLELRRPRHWRPARLDGVLGDHPQGPRQSQVIANGDSWPSAYSSWRRKRWALDFLDRSPWVAEAGFPVEQYRQLLAARPNNLRVELGDRRRQALAAAHHASTRWLVARRDWTGAPPPSHVLD